MIARSDSISSALTGGKSRMKVYRVLHALAMVVILLGCDVPYDLEICNGFDERVKILFVNRSFSPKQNRFIPIDSGQCVRPSNALPVEVSEVQIVRDLPEGAIVLDLEHHVLAIYTPGAFNEPPRLHAPLRVMIESDGVFHVPYEFQDSWLQNIARVKEKSRYSRPNLAVRK